MESKNTKPKEYIISEETAIFIAALEAYREATDKLIDGLYALYSEDTGDQIFHRDFVKKLDETEDLFYHALSLSMRNHLCDIDGNTI